MLLFKLIEPGQVLGHSVRVDAFGANSDDKLGQVLGHIVQANTYVKLIDSKLGHTFNT